MRRIKGQIDATKGRRAVFRGKRYVANGLLTKEGFAAFVQARDRLRQLVVNVTGKRLALISAGDVIEYLARGEQATREYLERKQ